MQKFPVAPQGVGWAPGRNRAAGRWNPVAATAPAEPGNDGRLGEAEGLDRPIQRRTLGGWTGESCRGHRSDHDWK